MQSKRSKHSESHTVLIQFYEIAECVALTVTQQDEWLARKREVGLTAVDC